MISKKKLLSAAIETVQQGLASAEETAWMKVLAEFEQAQQKRKRRRVLDEDRRATAFKQREAAIRIRHSSVCCSSVLHNLNAAFE